MSTLTLHDGTDLPAFGLGTWLSEPGAVHRAVREAIEIGYRHIDCAWIYDNEAEVGAAIAEAIAAGDVTREELWVTTKLWNDCHAPEHVRPALEGSLRSLGLDYVDLYLMHWPVALVHGVARPKDASELLSLEQMPLATTWEAMAKLPATELTRQIGVSNFSARHISMVSNAVDVVPVVNQIELHPYLSQTALLAAMKARGVVATAYAPLGSGGRPKSMRRDDETRLLDDPAVVAIASAHDASAAQVLLAWGLARGTAVIPKSTTSARLAENFAATKLVLTDDDIAALDALDRGERYVTGSFWCPPGSPYSVQSLWR
jgi:alcohol dehydrogenase (NADP+)